MVTTRTGENMQRSTPANVKRLREHEQRNRDWLDLPAGLRCFSSILAQGRSCASLGDKMRKRPFVFVCIALELALGLALVSAVAVTPASEELAQATLIFSRVLQIVRQDYVSPEKTGYRDLIYAALRGVVRWLDPHCEFYDPVA